MEKHNTTKNTRNVFENIINIVVYIVMILSATLLIAAEVNAEEEEQTEYFVEYKITSAVKNFTYSTGSYVCIDDTYTYVKVDGNEPLTLEASAASGYLIYEVYVDGESVDESFWNIDGLYKTMKYTLSDDGASITKDHTFEIKCISTSSDKACPDTYYVEHYHMNIDGETYTLYETVEYTFDGKYGDKVYGEQKYYDGFTSPETFEHVIMKLGENTTMKYYYDRNKYYFINGAYTNPDYVDITGTSEASEYYHGETIYLNATIVDEFVGIYIIDGWTDGENWYKATDSFVMPKDDVSLYVKTSVVSYKIKFNANGGEGTIPDTEPISYFDEYTLPDSGFTKDGYKLLGWSLKPDSTVTDYALGGDVVELTTDESITLYAVWGDLGETSFTVEHYVMNPNGEYILTETEVIESYTSEIYTSADLIKEKYNNKKTTFFLDMTEDEYSINMFLPKKDDVSIIKMYYARVQYMVNVEISYKENVSRRSDACYVDDTYNVNVESFTTYIEEVYGDVVIDKIVCNPTDLIYENNGDNISFKVNSDTEMYIYIRDSYSGMKKVNDTWYYYTDDKIDTSYTGMAKNPYGWWYIKEGKLDLTYTGMVKYNSNWVYVTKGKLNTTYTGLVKYKSNWIFVNKGKLDATYTGMAKNKYGWWYMKNGKLDLTYTGMAKNPYGWWQMTKGKLDLTYTGLSTNQYGMWYMTKGKLDLTYTGTATYGKESYNVVKGKVIK